VSKIKKPFLSYFIFFISIIIFAIIQILIYNLRIKIKSNTEIDKNILNENFSNINIANEENLQISNNDIWQIKIPCINLEADIKNGTDKETLNKYVGHFEKTQVEKGNIGLAGHNRGYDVNYFARLKELNKGDEIIYIHNDFVKTYEVTKNKIIADTNWDVLENTEDNVLTLITCVENQPEYRRCIQAEEKDLKYDY